MKAASAIGIAAAIIGLLVGATMEGTQVPSFLNIPAMLIVFPGTFGATLASTSMAVPFEKAGGFAPTLGIIGTVMGLVHVLQNLSQPATLGPAISGAFIATLYGVASANLVFLPIGNKLKGMSAQEAELRTMTLEGILSIQAGDNPRVVADKLLSFIPPEERASEGEGEEAGAPASEPELAAA